jgi:signal transduction histidine kinase
VQTVAVSPILQLIVSAPRTIHYIDNITMFAALIGFVFLVANLVDEKYRIIFKRIALLLVVLTITTMAIDITLQPFQRYISIPLYMAMLAIVVLFLSVSIKSYRSVAHHKQLFLLGLNAYALFAFIEILVYYMGIYNSAGNLGSWFLQAGALCLFFFLSWIVVSRFVEMNKQTIISLRHDRERIARDLHDEIGPRLTEIKMVGAMIKEHTLTGESANQKMDELMQASDQAVSSFGEIIWALTPSNNTVEELGSYLGQYASGFLEKFDISCRLVLPPEFHDLKIDYTLSRNLVMAVKEILNNIVKHAGASLVHVDINLTGNELHIEITDNGKGFDHSKVRPHGNGLKNISHRIEKTGGRVKVESLIGVGTSIRINIILGKNPEKGAVHRYYL